MKSPGQCAWDRYIAIVGISHLSPIQRWEDVPTEAQMVWEGYAKAYGDSWPARAA